MEIKFFTGEKVLNLSGQKISVQDTNSRMNDKMFSKYFFPFEIYMNEEFLTAFGDFESYDTADLENTFEGTLLFENRIHEAKLVLSAVEGKMITGQIDFGFEDLPNFNKKLAELPLEKFPVGDIHTFAKDICKKKYPETNFNFPRMYTSKYPPDQKVWDAFDGYYNDLKADGSEMRWNYINELGEIYNVNIIHPTPHFLYVLKTGFSDVNLTLAGDILTDPIFAQRWMFSGTDYFSSKQQRRFGFNFSSAEYDELFLENGPDDYCLYQKYNSIEKPGIYKIAGFIEFWKAKKMVANYAIKLNGNVIWSKIQGSDRQSVLERIPLNFDVNVTQENSELEIYIYTQYHEDSWSHQIADLLITSKVLEDIASTDLGDDSGVITNLNEIDLTRAVPDMTFGDFINHIRNRFNYELTVQDNLAIMNRIGDKEPTDIRDFTQFEIEYPKRELLNKKSFLLRAPESDENPQNSMYYDKDGAFLNKAPKEDTNIIESNVIILQVGVAKPLGYETAIIKKDTSDAVQLVWYDGLTGVQNNAKNPLGAEFPELFYSHWEKWLRQRIRGSRFQWKFKCDAEQFDYLINNHIYAYKNIHNLVSWTKDLVENTYEVDVISETI